MKEGPALPGPHFSDAVGFTRQQPGVAGGSGGRRGSAWLPRASAASPPRRSLCEMLRTRVKGGTVKQGHRQETKGEI